MRLFTRILGDRGERAAVKFLRRQGMRIVARNHRSRTGEIDLIARDGDTLVFVEVKTLGDDTQTSPTEHVDRRKQQQLTRLALEYLKRHNLLETRARFDVVSIVWPKTEKHPRITHYRNAFEPTGRYQFFG